MPPGDIPQAELYRKTFDYGEAAEKVFVSLSGVHLKMGTKKEMGAILC